MDGHRAYEIMLSVRLHFQGKRDIKYGIMKITPETFRASRDRFACEKVSRQCTDENALRNNAALLFFQNPKTTLGAVYAGNDLLAYSNKLFVTQLGSIDVRKLFHELKNSDALPHLFEQYANMELDEWFVCILLDVFNYDFDTHAKFPTQLPQRFKKLMPFVVYDKASVGKAIKSRFDTI